jgi:hypothetical protein
MRNVMKYPAVTADIIIFQNTKKYISSGTQVLLYVDK